MKATEPTERENSQISPDITSSSFDKGSCIYVFTGNNLVSNVVTQNVLVLAESINRPGVLVQYICRPKGIKTVNGAIHGQSKINSVVVQVSKRNVLGGKVSQTWYKCLPN